MPNASLENDTERSGVFIAGEWRAPAGHLLDRNPARPAEIVARIGVAGPDDVDDACAAAREAAPAWGRKTAAERAEVLWRTAAIVEGRLEQIAAELTREEGKPLKEARGEIARGIATMRYYAAEATQAVGALYPSAVADRFLYSVHEPLGVVALITPWNFPFGIPVWKLAPALAFGNTVVLKPSEEVPLSAVRLVEALDEAGAPPGVVNLICAERGEVGPALTAHPELDAISFTGSSAVGRTIRLAAAERNVKVQLELGGKNPVIVLDDADLDLAVERTILGAMASTGQKCTATSRVFATAGIADELTERLTTAVAGLRVGDPMESGTDIGPLVSRSQWEKVAGYLDGAGGDDLRPLIGGRTTGGEDGGWFVEPTVYDDVSPAAKIAREEVFGPVLAIMRADDFSAAITLANETSYGLSASLFTNDLARAFAFVRAIDAGIVHVNSESTVIEPHVPFGGLKESGSHSPEQGKAAFQFFTNSKTVYIDPVSSIPR